MSRANVLARTVSVVVLVNLAACTSTPEAADDAAGIDAYKQAIEAASQPATPEQIAAAERSDPLTRANFWGEEYRKDAANLETIIHFMRALRTINSHDRVLEIAQAALPIHPQSYEIYLELGRSSLRDQKTQQAAQAFVRSADFAPPDEAAPLAALGVAFDRLEEHGKAQEAYAYALAREPDRVSTLSNYGLSLALTGDLTQAEAHLRKAVDLPGADVRVRQNLALILGLQGRFDEMASVDPQAPRRTIEANRQALRDMMIPARNYDAMQAAEPIEIETPVFEPMPDVKEAEVETEALAMIPGNGPELAEADDLSGGTETKIGLRPKLRGAQDG